jgi:hypothetical protein
MFIMTFNKHFFPLTEHTTHQTIYSAYKNNSRINYRGDFCFGDGICSNPDPLHERRQADMRCDIHRSPGSQNRLQGSNSNLTVGTVVLQRRAAMRKGTRSVAIGWTEKLHATVVRYANRGSEDVKLEFTTMVPGVSGTRTSNLNLQRWCPVSVELTSQLKILHMKTLLYDTTVATSVND